MRRRAEVCQNGAFAADNPISAPFDEVRVDEVRVDEVRA